ncbi:MAG: hypothetical protein V2I33_24430, partial [Kangiellaceae bacterium]|nr:hypothetical protein [Kangiellaceae bacterium]
MVGVSFLASVYGIYCVAAFKIFGADNIPDDQFLAIIGSVGNFINGIGRLFWAQAMDWVPFKTVVMCLVGLQIVLSATIYWIVEFKAVYLIWVALSLACQGGIMSLYAAICGHVYGPTVGGKMTALVIYNIGIASVLVGLVQRFAITSIGYFAMFYILCGCSIISLLIHIFCYKDANKWNKPGGVADPLMSEKDKEK